MVLREAVTVVVHELAAFRGIGLDVHPDDVIVGGHEFDLFAEAREGDVCVIVRRILELAADERVLPEHIQKTHDQQDGEGDTRTPQQGVQS